MNTQKERTAPIGIIAPRDSPEYHEEALGWSISFPKSRSQTNLVDYVFNEVALKNISNDFKEESDDDFADD